jgi:hypothetical protein
MRYLTPAALCIMIAALSFGMPARRLHAAAPDTSLLCQVEERSGPTTTVLPADRVRPGTEKIDPPEKHRKNCPETRYVNCMPPVPEERRARCSREYIKWMKENCPGSEVVY